jgi:hypothetical protein
MRIEKDQIVGGLPARDVRRFMRSAAGTIIRPRTAAQICGLSTRKAEEFLHELQHEGLISPKEDYWEATAKGHAFAMATAAKPLRKVKAEQLLTVIVGRAQVINSDTRFAFRVHQLVLLGSVMKGAERPNDVDIGCTLVPRFEGGRQRVLEDQRRAERGRFANMGEWAAWPKLEVLKLLKLRSRGLSVQEIGDWTLGSMDHRVVFIDASKRNSRRSRVITAKAEVQKEPRLR